MADSSVRSANPKHVNANPKVWTFVIRAGEDFELSLPNNPKLKHNGGMTVWQMVGTYDVAAAAEVLILDTGASVERYTQEQTPKQAMERQRLLGFEE